MLYKYYNKNFFDFQILKSDTKEIRTPVTGMKTQRPEPLDDGAKLQLLDNVKICIKTRIFFLLHGVAVYYPLPTRTELLYRLTNFYSTLYKSIVHLKRVELLRLAAPDSKSDVSTNSTIGAYLAVYPSTGCHPLHLYFFLEDRYSPTSVRFYLSYSNKTQTAILFVFWLHEQILLICNNNVLLMVGALSTFSANSRVWTYDFFLVGKALSQLSYVGICI